jgi:hypothetical protein
MKPHRELVDGQSGDKQATKKNITKAAPKLLKNYPQHLSARDYSKKTDKTQNYQLAEALREYRDAMLLLTATPHAGDPNHGRFINLVKLLETNVDFAALVR